VPTIISGCRSWDRLLRGGLGREPLVVLHVRVDDQLGARSIQIVQNGFTLPVGKNVLEVVE